MKILVTGGAGFIGTNLVKHLKFDGHSVCVLDDYSTGTKQNHIEGVKYINGDIEMIEYLNTDFDLIYHLAAQSRVQPSFDDPTQTFRVNVKGTESVMEFARAKNIKVVYAGSSSKHHDPTDSPYAQYKFLGEEVCKLYRKTYDVNVEICRFYNAYGTYEPLDLENGNVIGIWREQIKLQRPITIIGDGEQKRDFIHVDDIVDGLVKVGLSDESHEDAWELGLGKNYSINELAGFFKETHLNLQTVYLPDQKGNYRETLNENTDAKDRLDWYPQDRLKDYILSL
jgi:UDP-glucose 4-epimerase